MKRYSFLILLLFQIIAHAQDAILEITNSNNEPVVSAQLLDSTHTIIGVSDVQGEIALKLKTNATYTIKRLGFENYIANLKQGRNHIQLRSKSSKQVEIKSKKIEKIKETSVDIIDRCELGKLACCNLAESFENSNTVDVSYSDGVTGGREIHMLGLAGTYSQQLLEGTPYQRGILGKIGLELIPGPWLESISVHRGVGSVVNGYDNLSGQINLEFVKPKKSMDWYVNGYISEIAKSDFNVIKGFQIKENLYTSILAHTSFSRMTMDNNNDGFTDMPKFTNINVMNRWQYFADNGFVMNSALQAVNYENEAGQILDHNAIPAHHPYTISQNTRAYHAMLKTGWELDAVKESSFAIIYRLTHANQSGNLDRRVIDNTENFFNISPIYQSNLSDVVKYKFGAQLLYDHVDEKLDTLSFTKKEWVPGIFTEWTFKSDWANVILGMRGDYHNTLGFFASPRASIQFTPSENHILKLNGGMGYRTPTYLNEAFGFLISNRAVVMPSALELERGINSGISYKYVYSILGSASSIEASYYLTIFQNQFILNVESPEVLKLEYLKDQSRAQSFQIENIMQIGKQWSLKLSYKNDQTMAMLNGEMKNIPLLKNDKFLANLYWVANNTQWRVSTTLLINGSARIPKLGTQSEYYSPLYPIVHAQVNFVPNKKMDFYIGSENIFSYAQQNRIQTFSNTESKSFDAGMIWGPMDIRRMYVGAKMNF